MNPTRTGILDVLRRMGCPVEELNPGPAGRTPADLRIRTASLTGTEISGDLIPKIIDEIPILAVAACRNPAGPWCGTPPNCVSRKPTVLPP